MVTDAPTANEFDGTGLVSRPEKRDPVDCETAMRGLVPSLTELTKQTGYS